MIRDNGRETGVRAGGETIPCDAFVVATGVWPKPLAEKSGISAPLEAERGYHIELREPSASPKAPVRVAAAKCVVPPMERRILIADIVEFGGLKAGTSQGPLELLRKYAHRILPGVTWKHEEEWLGCRPAPAGFFPVIGEVPGHSGAFVGFGRHHIGLSGGPKTGRLLAQMISGRTSNMDMSAYDPARYAI